MNLTGDRSFRILLAAQVRREAARICDGSGDERHIRDGVAEWVMLKALHTLEKVQTPYGPGTHLLDNLYGQDRDHEALVLSLCLASAILLDP